MANNFALLDSKLRHNWPRRPPFYPLSLVSDTVSATGLTFKSLHF